MIKKLKLYARVMWYRLKGWKIVYKVCKEKTFGHLVSAVVSSYSISLTVGYKINSISIPPTSIPNSKLFCFSNFRDAYLFEFGLFSGQILMCIAKVDSSVSNRIALPYHTGTFKPFWEKELEDVDILTQKPPQGTVFCDEVLPIRVVK